MANDDPIRMYARDVGLDPQIGGHANVQSALAGGAVGAPSFRAFSFTFDTANLLTGAPLYTPTVGDLLLDAWIEIDTAWDGTTPLGDVGSFAGGVGWCTAAGYGPVPMNVVDDTSGFGDPDLLSQGGIGPPSSVFQQIIGSRVKNNLYVATGGARALPAKFLTAAPILVCVSQDGTDTGGDPGSTVGAGIVYLVTVTPA